MAVASTPRNLLACRELGEINDAGLAVGVMAQVHTQNLWFFFFRNSQICVTEFGVGIHVNRGNFKAYHENFSRLAHGCEISIQNLMEDKEFEKSQRYL